MPKKPITGKSKLLTTTETLQQSVEALNLTHPKRTKPRLKNYRFTEADVEQLQKIVEAVNRISPYKNISETKVVKALILMGGRLKPEQILRAAKEVW